MKTCPISHKCCYGNCYEENTCAYDIDINESDPCPVYAEDWEYIIDKISEGDKDERQKYKRNCQF